jgi:hypothetical protein
MKFAVTMQRGRYTKTTNWTPAIISEIAGVEDRSHVTLEGVTTDGDPILGICSDGPHYRATAERLAEKVGQYSLALSWRVMPQSSRHAPFPARP